ncbi:unnamed protein product [marine sediment metagenome]|uniref:Uncharacterized protein n=1 Tax=marine sediment metagenome TaxID=412755 RepID=X1PII6_9ZZZZ
MPEQFKFGGEIVWRPNKDYLENARLTAFLKEHKLSDFNELMTHSLPSFSALVFTPPFKSDPAPDSVKDKAASFPSPLAARGRNLSFRFPEPQLAMGAHPKAL